MELGVIVDNPERTAHLKERMKLWDTWKEDWDSTDRVERELGEILFDTYREYFLKLCGTHGDWAALPELLKFVWVRTATRIFHEFGATPRKAKELESDRL